jgi:hypothetical protein
MPRLLTVIAVALTFFAAGCGGDGLLRTQGKLLKDGKPFVANEGEYIHVIFVPIRSDGKPPENHYVAEVDQSTGEFKPAGAQLKGMPPGKYRVAIELMKKRKDLLKGKFDEVNSPFVVDVDKDTKEIVIDLDKPPAK